MTRFLGLVTLTSALAISPALAQQAITNIDIEMSRNAGNGAFGIRAEVINPNDFAVKDVRVRCTMLDDKGNTLAAYDSTILATFPARQKIIVPRLEVGAWPPQATKATCTSSSAQRV